MDLCRRRRHRASGNGAPSPTIRSAAMTPTAGGIVFFGDLGGNFYALDSSTGQKLWGRKIGGAIGGGVITYTVDGVQKVAVATGLHDGRVADEATTAKVVNPGPRQRRREASEELGHGPRSRLPLAPPVRVRHQLPHHLPVLHDRVGGVAGDDRGRAARHRQPALPARVRFLAQGVRGLVRHGRGDGHRDGVPVRHQLGRAGAEDRLDPGAAARLRSLHRVHAGGDVLRRHAARARPRVAALLLLRLLHGLARDDVLVVLDPRQQQLDAGAARPHDRRRQDHPGGLAGDRARAGDDGALAAHAARRIPDDRHVRGGHRRLVRAARHPSRRGARDAALGPRAASRC